MNNKTQLNQSAEPAPTDPDYDAEQADEERWVAEFTRLYQQYRRAGYEYAQQIVQSNSNLQVGNDD